MLLRENSSVWLARAAVARQRCSTSLPGSKSPIAERCRLMANQLPAPAAIDSSCFRNRALFPWLNVFGNVLFGLKLKPNLTKKDRHDVAKYYLELVGLSRFERANIHELSGGMKQRVSLARALAPNPRMLLMDEPFAALDALTREQLYGDLQRIWKARKKTIVFVTHNVREAACLGDRVIVFSPRPGRIREEFAVDLPRPRDINSVDLAVHATEITKALKSYSQPEVAIAE